MHPLDNPAWNALTTLQRSVSSGNELARRFEPSISPIAAVMNSADPACWSALAEVVGAGSLVGVFAIDKDAPPEDWTVDWRYTLAQMTCTRASFKAPARAAAHPSMRVLTLADGNAMVELAALAQPGPMEARTVTLGRYLGIFDHDDKLIAMAGERMRLDGATEVSGVCTHPEHRGKRYAQLLSAAITETILERGDTAFLHVRDGNTGAASVYEKLGFGVRAVFDIAAVTKR
ncbi:GNAT family N-acetyltransferase [uncultured Caballeronia sp.]|uniref:GNAT family N-acetyltransferase n=1 Tax=uncultured Caballeronia sp. TaxID=1827198 RepID=UPI0015762D78